MNILEEEDPTNVKMAQACFLKDLEYYLSVFPVEEVEIREVFETVLNVGTSFRWENDRVKVKKLREVFTNINTQIIIPWTST